MVKNLRERIRGYFLAGPVLVGLAFGIGGCKSPEELERDLGPSRGVSSGAFLAAGATINAVNAASRGNHQEAAAWEGLAEYGRAKVISDAAAEAGRGRGQGDERNGVRTLRLGGDQVYRGEVLDGRPHGTGKLQYPNGDWYEGEFRNGVREGFGRLGGREGNIWEGRFHKDEYEGIWTIRLRKGGTITLYYRDGQRVSKEEYERTEKD